MLLGLYRMKLSPVAGLADEVAYISQRTIVSRLLAAPLTTSRNTLPRTYAIDLRPS